MIDAEKRSVTLTRAARDIFIFSDNGKFVLEHLERFAFADAETFNPDPAVAAYHQGRRSVILEIRRLLKPADNN